LTQLEAAAGTPVRVRRVNPPEDQRALLRSGHPAEPRMDTPMSLVEILKRKLPQQGMAPVRSASADPGPAAPAPASQPTVAAVADPGQPPQRPDAAHALPPLDARAGLS